MPLFLQIPTTCYFQDLINFTQPQFSWFPPFTQCTHFSFIFAFWDLISFVFSIQQTTSVGSFCTAYSLFIFNPHSFITQSFLILSPVILSLLIFILKSPVPVAFNFYISPDRTNSHFSYNEMGKMCFYTQFCFLGKYSFLTVGQGLPNPFLLRFAWLKISSILSPIFNNFLPRYTSSSTWFHFYHAIIHFFFRSVKLPWTVMH